jgi:class 3 adenylate cyclase
VRGVAPVRNGQGEAIGAVHIVTDLGQIENLVWETGIALWGVGSIVCALALAASWALGTPIVRTTRALSAAARQVAQGQYVPLERQRRWRWLVERISLRARLTIALALAVLALVATLEVVAIPIQRQHLERTIEGNLAGAAEWLAGLLAQGQVALPAPSALDNARSLVQDLDLGQLQALGDRVQHRDAAYLALADAAGEIQFSDQLSLIGTGVTVPKETTVVERTWRGAAIWEVSTPLRDGADGERRGALLLGMRRRPVERFLAQSRTRFRLVGLAALLAGILLAQVVGRLVAAPLRRLAAGIQDVGQGNLDHTFAVRSGGELQLLAGALNRMMAGLRERAWLRDMFGRFVSREVAEAIQEGRVRLEGENRVVSILFCDIRDFGRRLARQSPQTLMALLNAYLPVVVEAAEQHGGTVNKFGGDSTLIIYGAPRPLQESAYQAVRTALSVRAGLARLNKVLAAQGETPIEVGVGINTGVALAGAVGAEARQEYTVIGDTVNLASRIEALHTTYPGHDILISGHTYQALGNRRHEFAFVDLGQVSIRGKAEPVHVWAVTG